jgi:rod shape-determining protein MreC
MARAPRSSSTVDTMLLVGCGVVALVLTVLPVNMREALAGGLRRTVVAPLVSLQQQAERGRSAFLSREATVSKVDSLALRVAQLSALEHENDRLRAIVGLGARLRTGFVVAEALHSPSLTEEQTLTLTAGSRAGVKPTSPIVAPEGLVGQIKTVDPNVSVGIMWTNPDFRASGMTLDAAASGIVSAHVGGDGPERYLLELRGVAFRQTLKPGTQIVTSGLGGVFPRGIPVGTVLGEIKTAEGWTRTYLLRPAVRPPDVSAVIILIPERNEERLQTVWASPTSADSAARRVAAAGDSIARLAPRPATPDSARPVVAPREGVAGDSARRDSLRRDSARRARPDTTRTGTGVRRP